MLPTHPMYPLGFIPHWPQYPAQHRPLPMSSGSSEDPDLKRNMEIKDALRHVLECRRWNQQEDSGNESGAFHSDASSPSPVGTRSNSFSSSSGYKSPLTFLRPPTADSRFPETSQLPHTFSQFSVAHILNHSGPPPQKRQLQPPPPAQPPPNNLGSTLNQGPGRGNPTSESAAQAVSGGMTPFSISYSLAQPTPSIPSHSLLTPPTQPLPPFGSLLEPLTTVFPHHQQPPANPHPQHFHSQGTVSGHHHPDQSGSNPRQGPIIPGLLRPEGRGSESGVWEVPLPKKEAHSPGGSSTTHSASPTLHLSSSSSYNPICTVCEDKASGYHYGVVSCEGCKGFFRRTVQKRMDYHCHKEGGCRVNRITRNRCQACRFNKCLEAGMSKESVRQDGNRKRKFRDSKEEEELESTARTQNIISTILAAYLDAVGPDTSQETAGAGSFSTERFAQSLPGFKTLPAEDQRDLIIQATLEIKLLLAAYRRSLGGEVGDKQSGASEQCVQKLTTSFRQLAVCKEEIALLAAISVLCYTRSSLSAPELVEKLQEPIVEALRIQIQLRRSQHHHVFAKLLMKLAELRAVAENPS